MTAAAPPRRRASLTAGLNRDFWLLWGGWTVSSAGNGLTTTVLPLLAADLTSDPRQLSLVAFAGRLPWVLLALVGGVFADRWNRRTTMWAADALRFFLLMFLAGLVLGGRESILVLMIVAFGITAVETVYDSSRQSILPTLVGRDADTLQAANSRLQTAKNTAQQFVGPAVGGALYSAGRAIPTVLDALSFGISAVLTFLIRGDRDPVTPKAAGQKKSVWREIVEGCRFLFRHRVLRVYTVVAGFKNMGTAAMLALLVLYTREVMHTGDAQYGLLLSATAIGSIVGGFFCRRLARMLGPAVSSLGASAIGGLGFAILGITHHPAFVATGLAITGFTSTMWNVSIVSQRQALVPSRLTGRVNGVNRLVTFGTMPIGILLGGLIADRWGLVVLYLVGGLSGAAVALAGLLALSNGAIDDALRAVKPDSARTD
jgi:MFS family permease